MPSVSFEIRGLKELEENLKTLEPKLAKQAMRLAVRAGAKVFLDEMRSRVRVLTGKLQKSLRIGISTRSSKGMVSAAVWPSKQEAHIARFLEFGVLPHEIPARGKTLTILGIPIGPMVRHPGVAPKPFMRPAFDVGKNRALAVLQVKLAEAIDRLRFKT